MTDKHVPSRSLLALAAEWRALGLILVAIARQVARLRNAGGRGAWAKADWLELWVRTALAELTYDLHAIEARAGALSPEEARAFQHLQAIAAALTLLALFLQYLKLACGGQRDLLTALNNMIVVCALPSRLLAVPGFLDSG